MTKNKTAEELALKIVRNIYHGMKGKTFDECADHCAKVLSAALLAAEQRAQQGWRAIEALQKISKGKIEEAGNCYGMTSGEMQEVAADALLAIGNHATPDFGRGDGKNGLPLGAHTDFTGLLNLAKIDVSWRDDTHAKWIKGTPLENDVPVWMVEFAMRCMKHALASAPNTPDAGITATEYQRGKVDGLRWAANDCRRTAKAIKNFLAGGSDFMAGQFAGAETCAEEIEAKIKEIEK